MMDLPSAPAEVSEVALPTAASPPSPSPSASASPPPPPLEPNAAAASSSSSSSASAPSAATLSAKERKRQHRWEQKNRWMPHYQLKYGVLPVEFGAARALDGAPVVLKAKCRFCECFGRELTSASSASVSSQATPATATASRSSALEHAFAAAEDEEMAASASDPLASTGPPPVKRRKKRQTLKVFGPNFRTDNLESHLSREHPGKWKEFERLKDAEKQHFFPDPPPTAAALEQAAAAASFASTLGLTLGSTAVLASHHAGGAGMMFLPSHTPRLGSAVSGTPASSASTSASLGAANASMSAADSAASSNKLLGFSLTEKPAALMAVGGGNSTGRPAVPVTSAIVELLNQLLMNHRGKQIGVETSALVSSGDAGANGKVMVGAASSSSASTTATLIWQHFVRVDEALERKQVALTALAADPTDATLEIPYPEPILSFVADVFAAGLDIQPTLAALVAALRLHPFEPLLRDEPTLEFVATAVRHITAVNFANLAPLMASVWGCALVLRFDMQNSSGFVDVRVQLPVHDEVHDLHVLAVPLDAQRHSTESLGVAVVRALAAVDPLALQKLVGVTVDGDPFHMKNYLDVAAWVRRAASAAVGTPGAAFYVLHSAPFLLSHVVEELLEICEVEFDFYATLLQVEALAMSSSGGQGGSGRAGAIDAIEGARSPRPRSVRGNYRHVHWIEVYELCHWCAIHRETLVRLCTEKQQQEEQQRSSSSGRWPAPSNVWWALVFVFRDLLKDILSVYTKCSRHATSFADVQRHLRELVFQLKLKFNIKPSDMDAAADAADAAMEPMTASPSKPDISGGGVNSSGTDGDGGRASGTSGENHDGAAAAAVAAAVAEADSFSVDPSDFSYQDFVNAVIHLDMFMYEAFHSRSIENFTDADRTTVYQRFNVLLLLLISKLQTVTSVSADSSSSGSSSISTGATGGSSSGGTSAEDSSFADLRLYSADIPPSTPYELITMNNLTFMELLNSQQTRIRAKWSGKVVAMITEDRNRMVAEFAQRGAFYDAVTAFAKQQHQGDVTFRDAWRLSALEFPSLCSLAAPFGALLAVSRDHRDASRSRETTWDSNLALEGLLHGRQLQTLAALRKQLDTIV